MSEFADFYRRPGPTSGLGRHRALVHGLPDGAGALGAIVRGLLIHDYDAKTGAAEFSAERMAHMRTASAEAILDNVLGIDPGPLSAARPAERRMVGFCYHFALLHCALLRATGTPARVRCGFASYFETGIWMDHWVTEYRDGGTWRLTDPQLGRDLADGDFQDGPAAWHQCRSGASVPSAYGNGTLWGWDELRGTLVNDVGALAKVEVSGWYWCDRLKVEPLDQPHDELDASLDVLARRAAGANSPDAVRECFGLYPDLRPPPDAVAA